MQKIGSVGAALEFEFPQIDLLAGSRKISGQVVDAEGKPVAGASLSCPTLPGKVIFGGYGSTNAQGKFMLVGLPQDSLTLEVKSGRELRASVLVEAQQNDVRIELP